MFRQILVTFSWRTIPCYTMNENMYDFISNKIIFLSSFSVQTYLCKKISCLNTIDSNLISSHRSGERIAGQSFMSGVMFYIIYFILILGVCFKTWFWWCKIIWDIWLLVPSIHVLRIQPFVCVLFYISLTTLILHKPNQYNLLQSTFNLTIKFHGYLEMTSFTQHKAISLF